MNPVPLTMVLPTPPDNLGAAAQVVQGVAASKPLESQWKNTGLRQSRITCSLVTMVATPETAVTSKAARHQQPQRHKQHKEGTDHALGRSRGGSKVQALKYNQKQLRIRITKALPK